MALPTAAALRSFHRAGHWLSEWPGGTGKPRRPGPLDRLDMGGGRTSAFRPLIAGGQDCVGGTFLHPRPGQGKCFPSLRSCGGQTLHRASTGCMVLQGGGIGLHASPRTSSRSPSLLTARALARSWVPQLGFRKRHNGRFIPSPVVGRGQEQQQQQQQQESQLLYVQRDRHGIAGGRGAHVAVWARGKSAGSNPDDSGYVEEEGHRTNAALASESVVSESEGEEENGAQGFAQTEARLRRLEVLVLLRRLYRDVIRSERLLEGPLPKVRLSDSDASDGAPPKPKQSQRRKRPLAPQWWGPGRKRDTEWVVDSPLEILDYADDIRELSVALQRDLRGVAGLLPVVFQEDPGAEAMVRGTVAKIAERLLELSSRVEAGLSKEEMGRAQREGQERVEEVGQVLSRLRMADLPTASVLERFVERLRGVGAVDLMRTKDGQLRIAQFDPFKIPERLGGAAVSLRNVWQRLNGTAGQQPGGAGGAELMSAGLPGPMPTAKEVLDEAKLQLILEVEALDKKLREVSRERESRLRDKDVLARTRFANEIKALDNQVEELRKTLAVRTLQLEMELIFGCLEEEVLQITEDVRTDEEESLLVAEFGLLDAELAMLRAEVDGSQAFFIQDDELAALATDIPDLKSRLGIEEAATIPLEQRASLAASDGVKKLREGVQFYGRGLRLLAGDVVYAVKLILIAVRGTTLKPREVKTLRRTLQDLFCLIPFTIILIVPLSPVGHVLVFSFLQRYFPGFFPSSFTNKRQAVMLRYEQIREQIQRAQTKREREEAAAAAAIAAQETYEAAIEEEAAAEARDGDRAGATRRLRRTTSGRGLLLGSAGAVPEIRRRVASVRENYSLGASSVVREGLRSLGLSDEELAQDSSRQAAQARVWTRNSATELGARAAGGATENGSSS